MQFWPCLFLAPVLALALCNPGKAADARAMMASAKRWDHDANASGTSTRMANPQKVAYSVARSVYRGRDTYSFIVASSLTDTGAAIFKINGMGAVNVYNRFGVNHMRRGEVPGRQLAQVYYDRRELALINGKETSYVATTAALSAASTTTYTNGVWRADYSSGLGAPPLFYAPSGSACSLNNGNGDNGSQVKSADGKCWVALIPATGLSPSEWGADPTGASDSSAQVVAAASALAGGVMRIGKNELFKLSSAVAFSGQLTIIGSLNPGFTNSCTSGFIAGSPNLNLLTFLGNGGGIRDACIAMAASYSTNTAGTALTLGGNDSIQTNGNFADNVLILNPFIGVDVSGNTTRLTNSIIQAVDGANSVGVRVGYYSKGKSTVDPTISHVTVSGVNGSSTACHANLQVLDAGGLNDGPNNDFLFCQIGTAIQPGENQSVTGRSFNNYDGDSNTISGIIVNPTSSTGKVTLLDFNNCWASGNATTTSHGVTLSNTASGIVTGVHFSGCRTLGNGESGFWVGSGVSDWSWQNSWSCGNNYNNHSSNGITLEPGVSNGIISGSTSQSLCLGYVGGTHTMNLRLDGSNTNLTIVGNNFSSNNGETAIGGKPQSTISGAAVVANNKGIDDVIPPAITSATSITLYANPVNVISGTTTISTMFGWWDNRQVTIIPTGTLRFQTGGGLGGQASMCNNVTAAAQVPVIAQYDAGNGCWHLK